MSIDYSYGMFERLSDQVGGGPALKLCAFFGGTKAIYVPVRASDQHIINKLIGPAAFADLVTAFAGQTIPLPALEIEPLRNAGRVFVLRDSGLGTRKMGALLGLSHARVAQILNELKRQGFDDLAIQLNESEIEEVAV